MTMSDVLVPYDNNLPEGTVLDLIEWRLDECAVCREPVERPLWHGDTHSGALCDQHYTELLEILSEMGCSRLLQKYFERDYHRCDECNEPITKPVWQEDILFGGWCPEHYPEMVVEFARAIGDDPL